MLAKKSRSPRENRPSQRLSGATRTAPQEIAMHRIVTVLGQVDVSPDSSGMPGAELIQKLLNWSQMIALWGSLAALLIGAAMYGLARESGGYGGATKGKSLAL